MILHTKYWISSGQGDFPPEISTAGSVLGKKKSTGTWQDRADWKGWSGERQSNEIRHKGKGCKAEGKKVGSVAGREERQK